MSCPSPARRVLYAWEWGAGSGHVQRFLPIARALLERGDEVWMAVKDPSRIPACIAGKVHVLQTPPWPRCPSPQRMLPSNLAAIAWNLGFFDPEALGRVIRVWSRLFEQIRPDLVIQDFGLTAGFVARLRDIPVIRIGTGYTCPPLASMPIPLPEHDNANGSTVVDRLLESLSVCCASLAIPKPVGWDQVLVGCPRNDILATLPPLDPYAKHPARSHWDGVWSNPPNTEDTFVCPPQPPNGETKPAVLAYLKPFAHWQLFFECLARLEVRVDLVADGVSESLLRSCDARLVRIMERHQSLPAAARQGKVLINNGNHGSTALALLHGMPVIACPLYFEQRLTAERVAKMGVGDSINLDQPDSFFGQLQAALTDNEVRCRANRFQRRYAACYFDSTDRWLSKLHAMPDAPAVKRIRHTR